jgi:hypothetical protein
MTSIRADLARRSSPLSILRTVAALGLAIWALTLVSTTASKPLSEQPAPDSVEYADGAWQLGHGHGYVTFFNERTSSFGQVGRPPRYPFGTAVALAPFAAAVNRFPQGPQLGSRVITALYVVAMVAAGWLLGGPLASAAVALLIGLSPFTQVSASLILSDSLSALLTVGILIALTVGSGNRVAAVAGALAGALVCVRLLGVVALPGVLLALGGRRRLIAALFAAPFLGALGLYQWQTFGSPLRTGYSYWVPGLHEFSPSYVLAHPSSADGPFVYPDKLNGRLLHVVCPCGVGGPMSKLPNLAFYPSVLAGLFWVFAPPLTALIGLWQLFVEHTTPAARFTLVTIVLNVGLVLFYFYSAARFVAPAASLLTVYAAVALARLIAGLGRASLRLARHAAARPASVGSGN